MQPVSGSPISGDRFKATVTLEMDGLTKGIYYALGDQLQGRLFIVPKYNMEVRSINVLLEYVVKGKRRTTRRRLRQARLRGATTLTAGKPHEIPFQIISEFDVQSYEGKHLIGFWQLSVYIDYDPNQYQRFIGDKLIDAFKDRRHGTAFIIPVRSGKGSYQVRGRTLPISLLDKKFFRYLIITAAVIGGFAINIINITHSITAGTFLKVAIVCVLLVAVVWHYVRLNTFQMTPLELTPLRDGQLRFRALDRGNNQLDKAMIGYRLTERYLEKTGKNEAFKQHTVYEKANRFADLAHRKEHLYEVLLPWPRQQFTPTTLVQEGIGFEWEVFLRLNGQEVSWPVEVGWERFRLPEVPTERLELKQLEKLKVPDKQER